MKNKKGFTLIELLAVIVILAIIALIATPIVLNMINSARKSSAKSSTLGFIDSIEYYAGFHQAKDGGDLGIEGYEKEVPTEKCIMENKTWTTCSEFMTDVKTKSKGSAPTDAKITLNASGKVQVGAWMKYNGYTCTYDGKDVTCGGSSSTTPTTPVPEVTYKCKRATTLHTETCSQTNSTYYCGADGYTQGSTITYGNLGSGSTLATGDAFTCDVNGDGEYNEETERFYYVTDMNSDTAVLIYYNNVTAGNPDNMKLYAYNTDTSGYLGPQTAKLQLPTTTQWKNVSLTNTTRDIKDELGTTRVSGFSYSGYASRLLTYEEVNNGCYDGTTAITSTKGLSSKCKFLMENTKYSSSSIQTYGLWLETPSSSGASSACRVASNSRSVSNGTVNYASNNGVRPAIEVNKNDIEI